MREVHTVPEDFENLSRPPNEAGSILRGCYVPSVMSSGHRRLSSQGAAHRALGDERTIFGPLITQRDDFLVGCRITILLCFRHAGELNDRETPGRRPVEGGQLFAATEEGATRGLDKLSDLPMCERTASATCMPAVTPANFVHLLAAGCDPTQPRRGSAGASAYWDEPAVLLRCAHGKPSSGVDSCSSAQATSNSGSSASASVS